MNRSSPELKYWLQLTCTTPPHSPCQSVKAKPQRIFLGKQYPNIYFSTREAQCVYLLLQKKKRKQIADQLNLSIRTIEAYLTQAKIKIQCNSQKKLVRAIIKTDFLKNYSKQIKRS